MNTKEMYTNYLLNTYKRVGPIFAKGKGSYLWDEEGNKYLDLFPGWGVGILGHCHPRIVAAGSSQLKSLIHLPNNLYHRTQATLAQTIIKNSFPGKVFFGNSGAEAIEGAVKISRLFGREHGKFEIITMADSFHGRTFAAMSATGQAKYKKPFEPLLATFKESVLNDLASFKKLLTDKTVAVMLELVQGEGGVNIADRSYITELYNFCKTNGLLFIVDEVQTGMARTGQLFCYQHYNIIPDILVLSKGLGAGVPISAIVVQEDLTGLLQPGLHASTFGGNPFVTRVSQEVFDIIREEKIIANTKAQGAYLLKQLKSMQKSVSIIKDVRGVGLMIGVELVKESFPVFLKALEKKLIINSTHDTVLRIMPALTVTRNDLDKGLEILEKILKDYN